jgi:heptaprenyl diphosphate synthase
MKKTDKIAVSAMMIALAMVLSFLETLIPPLVAVPGIKPGIANAVTVFILYKMKPPYAALVSSLRVCLSSLLFGSVVSFWYSAAGAILSFFVMLLLQRSKLFSVVGVSVSGAVMHNAAQIGVAALVMGTSEIVSYLPVLVISGVISGICVGVIAGVVMKRIKKI